MPQVRRCRCPYVVVRGLRGAENGGASWAAELRERVGDGWQGGWTQLLLFLQAPAEGDIHTSLSYLTKERLIILYTYDHWYHLGVEKVLKKHYIALKS